MNNERNLTQAKSLRKNMTEAEQKLWFYLRAKRFMGIKFKRQKPIGMYIVDFVALEEKLVIELDGLHHIETNEYDSKRTEYLENYGFHIIRFWNHECLGNITGVLNRIAEEFPSPTLRASSPTLGEEEYCIDT
jgi:very-short-patch-repair endonuclease